jgi:hypothetical protein
MRIDQDTLNFLKAGEKPVKKHKYNAKAVVIDGIKFPSIREGKRYQDLKLMQHTGIISDLKTQPKKFLLQEGFRHKSWPRKIPVITYTPDFSYIMDGKLIYEDCKGKRTAPYILRRKMLLKKYPDINFRET